DLAVTERPALRREVEGKDADLGDEWVHGPLLGLAGEDPEQRNDEVDAEVGLEIVVRLTAAVRARRAGCHRGGGRGRVIKLDRLELSENIARGGALRREAGRRQECVAMGWNLRHGERDRLDAAGFRQRETVAEVQ